MRGVIIVYYASRGLREGLRRDWQFDGNGWPVRLKVAGDPLDLPIAVASGVGPFPPPDLLGCALCERSPPLRVSASRLGFGERAQRGRRQFLRASIYR
jgi:hypothetical protein